MVFLPWASLTTLLINQKWQDNNSIFQIDCNFIWYIYGCFIYRKKIYYISFSKLLFTIFNRYDIITMFVIYIELFTLFCTVILYI